MDAEGAGFAGTGGQAILKASAAVICSDQIIPPIDNRQGHAVAV